MQFSTILKELRIELGYTQMQLARKANLATSCIAMLETNKREPNSNTLIALCRALDVSADYLLGLEDDFGTRIPAPVATNAAPMGESITSEERELIENYRELNASGKKLVVETIKTLLTALGKSERKKNIN